MKLKELLDVYSTPAFDLIDLEDEHYQSFLRGYTIKDMIEDHPEYLDLKVMAFVVYPGGDQVDSVRFCVRVDTCAED